MIFKWPSSWLIPSGSSVLIRLDDDHLDADGGAQQVDHLLVGQRGHRHLTDLHQPAALPQTGLPRVSERLHVSHDALEVNVEAQLPETVPAQGHFCGFTAARDHLEQDRERERNQTLYITDYQSQKASYLFRKSTLTTFNGTFSFLSLTEKSSVDILYSSLFWKVIWV